MAFAESLRFHILLDLAKRLIFAVDAVRVPLRSPDFRAPKPPPGGIPIRMASGSHTLAAWFVRAEDPHAPAVLLFHGIGDRLHFWREAQFLLARAGIASMVFHYSGYPGSGGRTTPAALERDAHAAYARLRSLAPESQATFLLGFSLGTGLAASVAGSLQPPPAGLILAQGFTSLRHAARRAARPAPFLAILLPDLWRTHEQVQKLSMPLLLTHSTGDKLFPVAMAQELYAAASAGDRDVRLEIFDRHAHNALFAAMPREYWQCIIDFIRRIPSADENAPHAAVKWKDG